MTATSACVMTASLLSRRQLEGAPDRGPDLLGRDAGGQRLLGRAPAELRHDELVGPAAVVARPQGLLHPAPELGVPHMPQNRTARVTIHSWPLPPTPWVSCSTRQPASASTARSGCSRQ